MEWPDLKRRLAGTPLLPLLPEETWARWAGRFTVEKAKLGQVVTRAGEDIGGWRLVLDGRARVLEERDGVETTRAILEAGQHWGADALRAPGASPYTVRASGELTCVRLSADDLRAMVAENAALRAYLEEYALPVRAVSAAGPVTDDAPPVPAAASPLPGEPAGDAAADAPEEVSFPRAKRFPEVRQISETDCAAACLGMVLRYFGKHVDLARLRNLTNVSRDGATFHSLAEAAETLGFQTRGIRGNAESLDKVELPAIAHWENFHYVVVYAVRRDHVVIGDPAIGVRRVKRAEFLRGWTGFLLLLSPTSRLAKTAESHTPLERYLPLLTPYRGVFRDIILGSILLQVLGLASPVFTQVIVDRVLVHQSMGTLTVLLIGMLLVALCQTGVVAMRYYLVVHTARRMHLQVAIAFYRHLLSLPLRFFQERRIGEMLKRFNENGRIHDMLTGRVINTLLDCSLIVIYVALMLFYNVKMTLVVLSFLPGYALLAWYLTPILRRQHRENFEKVVEAESQLVESVTGIGTVKALRAEQGLVWKWQNLMARALNVQFQNARTNMTAIALANTLSTLSAIVLVWFGARLVLAGELSVGQLVAFNVIAVTLTHPILNLTVLWNDLQEVRISLERLSDVYDAVPEEDASHPALRHLPPAAGHIRFEDVTFRYSGRDNNVLQNIDLEILPGQTVAFVGRSGAGKSTLASLLLRMYEPSSGRITVDGYDLRHVTLSSLRTQVGAVLQDSFLFSGTLRENIAPGDPDAPVAAVAGAAMLAGAHEFIKDLPLGYDTRVGEQGQSLSGGQKQRVAIARALYRDPSILILDEATSALDAESERAVQRGFEKALQGRTTLIIAHRLSTVRQADRIVVLDEGKIVETGTHDQLLAAGGLYAHLYSQGLADA